MRERPCSDYTRERVEALWGGEESLSPADVARLPIPIADRMWALGSLLYRLSPHRAGRVARLVALDVIGLWDPPDVVVWFLGTGLGGPSAALAAVEAVRAARDADETARAAPKAAEAASEAASLSAWSVALVAAGAVWASAEAAVKATGDVEAITRTANVAWTSTMKKYLSWVIKALDPFTPMGDIL